ncbi:hypothetical protein D9M72_292280 [compost metagenome]
MRIGLALVLKPSFFKINKPGIYCPVKVIKNKGKAILNAELIEKAGAVKIGDANFSSNPAKLIRDWSNRKIKPNSKTLTMAYRAEKRLVMR